MKKLAALLLLLFACACDDPSMIVVTNGYAAGTSVDGAWWSATFVPDAIDPGADSPAYRTVPGTDYAYAVLLRDGAPIAVRTKEQLVLERGATLHVVLAPDTVAGDCANGAPLTQAEADEITQSILPGPFEGTVYDAATCKTFRPATSDAGAD